MSNSRLKRSRRAVVLLAVLVCLGVSLALMTICFKQALQMRRELKLECQQMQSAWLMELLSSEHYKNISRILLTRVRFGNLLSITQKITSPKSWLNGSNHPTNLSSLVRKYA